MVIYDQKNSIINPESLGEIGRNGRTASGGVYRVNQLIIVNAHFVGCFS